MISAAHFLMSRIIDHQLILDPVFIHSAGAVCIDLTEIEFSGIFMIKDIETGNRKNGVISVRDQDQFFQFLRERKQCSVIFMGQILFDHLFKNTVCCSYDLLKLSDHFLRI